MVKLGKFGKLTQRAERNYKNNEVSALILKSIFNIWDLLYCRLRPLAVELADRNNDK